MLLSCPWIFILCQLGPKGLQSTLLLDVHRLLCIPGGLGLDQWVIYGRDDMPPGAPSPCSTFLILSLYLCHQADLTAIAIPTTPSFFSPLLKANDVPDSEGHKSEAGVPRSVVLEVDTWIPPSRGTDWSRTEPRGSTVACDVKAWSRSGPVWTRTYMTLRMDKCGDLESLGPGWHHMTSIGS